MLGLFFDVQPKPGHMVHYFDHVARLKPVLAQHRGMLFLERYSPLDDPEALLSHQLWADDAAMAAWRADPEHRRSQAAGRHVHFEGYRIRVGAQLLHLPGGARDTGGAGDGPARGLAALYGPAPATLPGGRAYESVTTPGRFVTLWSGEDLTGMQAQGAEAVARDPDATEFRLFGLQRDYSLTDRAEAPPR